MILEFKQKSIKNEKKLKEIKSFCSKINKNK